MKQLKRIKLNEFAEMTNKEMKFIVGGSGSGSGSGSHTGTEGDPIPLPEVIVGPDKFSACSGKAEGDECFFWYERNWYRGRCRAFPIDYVIHCSDLN